jgi:hypothetical protein
VSIRSASDVVNANIMVGRKDIMAALGVAGDPS